MIAKPRFKASFDLHIVDDQILFLQDEHRSAILEGRVYPLLADLLDGEQTTANIVAALGDRIPIQNVFFALNLLERRNYIVDGEQNPVQSDSAFLEYKYKRSGEDGSRPPNHANLEQLKVSATGVGEISTDSLIASLQSNGLNVCDDGDFLMVVTDDYLRPQLADINRACLASGKPWMLIKPVGMILWLGPLFLPGDTGCWSCLAHRLDANRQMEKYILEQRGQDGSIISSVARLPATAGLACDMAVTELVNWIADPDNHRLRGHLLTYDVAARKLEKHSLVKRPQCKECGDSTIKLNRESAPITLNSRKKKFSEDGGHRSLTPVETYERYRHHVSPILGAVTELVPAFGPKNPLTHSFVAGHNFSMGIDSIVFLKESLRGMSGGKGSTEIQAKVSGLCEAIERYSGIYWGDEHTIRGSYRSLAPEAVHPNECMGFSDEQYRVRHEWNASQPDSRCHLITDPFDEDLETDWTPLWSLTHERFRYLPTAYCYYGHPDFRDARWCSPDSNGSAAGNGVEEAIFQGAMELVERDAVALWWYNRLLKPGVDLDSFDMPYVRAIQEYYATINRDIQVIDLTSDLGICTLACISRRTDQEIEDIVLGFGAHYDPKIALLRAITEVNQFLPSVSLKNPDGSTRYLFGDDLARQWWSTAKIADKPYLMPDPNQPAKRLQDFSDPSSDDLLTDIQVFIDIIKQHDMEMLVMDQTRPDIGLSVVKVVVPELCHFWRRFGKQRLFDAPVIMGCLDTPRKPDELNPHSIFF